MEITVSVGKLQAALKALNGITSLKGVQTEHKYFGIKGTKKGITLIACNPDMMGVCDWEGDSEVVVKDVEDEFQTAMIDGYLLYSLLNTFHFDDNFKITIKDSSIYTFSCDRRNHKSEQLFNYDAKFEYLNQISDYGKSFAPSAEWEEITIKEDGIGLCEILSQVAFCMPRSDMQEDRPDGSKVRYSSILFTVEDQEEGSRIKVQTTDKEKFAYFSMFHNERLPEGKFILDHTIVTQILRLKSTSLFYNGKSFAFMGGPHNVTLYCRVIGDESMSANLNGVFKAFSDPTKVESSSVSKDDLISAVKSQLLFADRFESLLVSQLEIDSDKKSFNWGANNKIAKGSDSVFYEKISDKMTSCKVSFDDEKMQVNLLGFLSYLDQVQYSKIKIDLVSAGGGSSVFVAFSPDFSSSLEDFINKEEATDEDIAIDKLVEDDMEFVEDEEGVEGLVITAHSKFRASPNTVLSAPEAKFMFVTAAKREAVILPEKRKEDEKEEEDKPKSKKKSKSSKK